MDQKLKDALSFSNYRLTLINRKQNLKMRFKTACTFGYNNSMFESSKELINFTKLIIETGNVQYVFLDTNENPVLITTLDDFFSKLLGNYTAALNDYYSNLEQLKSAKTVEDVVGSVKDEQPQ